VDKRKIPFNSHAGKASKMEFDGTEYNSQHFMTTYNDIQLKITPPTMSLNSQLIAIAKACGWKFLNSPEDHGTATEWQNGYWVLFDAHGNRVKEWHSLPDYLSDLNAMHEAIITVIHPNIHLRRTYLNHLDAITGDQWNSVDATPSHRAEAFLRTLGLWEDGV
jgi:hypothetical protein